MTTTDIAGLCERLKNYAASEISPDNSLPLKLRVGPIMFRNACTEAADTLERQAAEIERLREGVDLLGSVPVLIIDRNAAHATDDKAAVEYADAMLPWAKRAKAFLARAALTGEDT